MGKSSDIVQNNSLKRIVCVAKKELHELYNSFPISRAKVEVCAPKEAGKFLKMNDIDLILLDYGSETEKGLDLLKKLKVLRPDVPVVFLTDNKSWEVAIEAFRFGARNVIGKPADIFEVKASIERLLQIKRGLQEKRSQVSLRRNGRTEKYAPIITTDLPANILRAILYIEKNLYKNMSLAGIAREAYLSKYHFCRSFSKYVGMAPMAFASWMKIRRAKELLKRRDLSVSSIALEVGFNDLGAFIKQFKKHTGVTPRFFKKSS